MFRRYSSFVPHRFRGISGAFEDAEKKRISSVGDLPGSEYSLYQDREVSPTANTQFYSEPDLHRCARRASPRSFASVVCSRLAKVSQSHRRVVSSAMPVVSVCRRRGVRRIPVGRRFCLPSVRLEVED